MEKLFNEVKVLLFLSRALVLNIFLSSFFWCDTSFGLSGTDAGDLITLSKAAKVQVHVQVQVHLFTLIQLQYNDKGKKRKK